ncbi:hypothetical protein ACSILI_004410, partial [Yersinia enterocolitica]
PAHQHPASPLTPAEHGGLSASALTPAFTLSPSGARQHDRKRINIRRSPLAPAERGSMTASASTSGVTLSPSGARQHDCQRISIRRHP